MALPSLTVPSIQRPKAGLLLVCRQIRAAFARFRWEGARRLPALQLWDPIGAEQDGGWEGGIERKKDCKQTKTLRISVERSRDGSADIWMFAISICCLWDLFWRQGKGKREGKKPSERELICSEWTPRKMFDLTRTTSEKKINLKIINTDICTYAQLNALRMRVTRNRKVVCNSLIQKTLCTVLRTINVCMNDCVFQSKLAVPYDEFLLLRLFPACCSSGSWTAGLCILITRFYAWSEATKRWTFPPLCIIVVTVLLSLYISWIFGLKATNCYRRSLCSISVNMLFACTMQPLEVYFCLIKAV